MAWILVAVFETEKEASRAQAQTAQGGVLGPGASWSFLSEATDPEATVAILERREDRRGPDDDDVDVVREESVFHRDGDRDA